MIVGIAFGSNLGDREGNIRAALEQLNVLAVTETSFRVSSIRETEPVDCPEDAKPFLNGVVTFDYGGTPVSLLNATQDIEQQLGRPADREKNQPRTIDLDLLFFGALEMNTPELQLPHPKIAERRFVLEPLAELHPDLILPGQKATIQQLLNRLAEQI